MSFIFNASLSGNNLSFIVFFLALSFLDHLGQKVYKNGMCVLFVTFPCVFILSFSIKNKTWSVLAWFREKRSSLEFVFVLANQIPVAFVYFRCQRSSQCPMCWQSISLKDPTGLVLFFFLLVILLFYFLFDGGFIYLSLFHQSGIARGCCTGEESPLQSI